MLKIGHIQFRKAAGDVVKQQVVAAYDAVFVGFEPFLIVIKQIGNPVHGHSGFPAARHSLDDQVGEGRFPDDGILLFLDGGDDLAQDRVLVAGKILHQQLVVGSHVAVIKTLQLPSFNIIGPLQVKVDGNGLFVRQPVTAPPRFVFIINGGNGRPPVGNEHVGPVLEYAVFSDINPFFFFLFQIRVINAAEIRLFQGGPVFAQGIFGVLF